MKTILSLVFYIGGNFEPMAQKSITEKSVKKTSYPRRKRILLVIQVDKHSDPISYFIDNFKRQFEDTKDLGLGRMFGGKRTEPQKETIKPESLIGATKTVMLSDFKNDEKSQNVQTNKKAALKMGNTIKTQQTRLKNNKPKLGL